ncbi:hypothetical protein PR048_003041 [Dryococelus australis]|uniref:Uncharacterized protein n=1 Tax=Dryococelus australis TaxID=614101 RepID=A0ABQ9ILY3_9NEOP|nr:hypothetical protein PR048_003041 [Dryococelus australis]
MEQRRNENTGGMGDPPENPDPDEWMVDWSFNDIRARRETRGERSEQREENLRLRASTQRIGPRWCSGQTTKANRVRFPGELTPGFSHVEFVPDDAAGRRIFSGSPVSPAPAFRRYSILTSLHPHRLSRSRCLEPPKSLNSTQLTNPKFFTHLSILGNNAGMQGRGEREIPEKTRRPTAKSGAISICKNPEAAPPGIKPGSPGWEASIVTTTPPCPPPPTSRVAGRPTWTGRPRPSVVEGQRLCGWPRAKLGRKPGKARVWRRDFCHNVCDVAGFQETQQIASSCSRLAAATLTAPRFVFLLPVGNTFIRGERGPVGHVLEVAAIDLEAGVQTTPKVVKGTGEDMLRDAVELGPLLKDSFCKAFPLTPDLFGEHITPDVTGGMRAG